MTVKRRRIDGDAGDGIARSDSLSSTAVHSPSQPAKRPRHTGTSKPSSSSSWPSRAQRKSGADFLSRLSDEVLLRVLSFLAPRQLLGVAPTSRRLHRLAGDAHLWKALYYARFVLPRALRIPGFHAGGGAAGRDHKLHYSGRRTLWADGTRGGVVRDERGGNRKAVSSGRYGAYEGREWKMKDDEDPWERDRVDWKRQYKIRHNWARGRCAVEELPVGDEAGEITGQDERKMLVKVVEGIAVTVDRAGGLRVWDLKLRTLLAQTDLRGESATDDPVPSCLAVDDGALDQDQLNVAVGFVDGSFGLWQLRVKDQLLAERYRHGPSSNGELIAMALSYPYLLTATASVLISVYTFDVPNEEDADASAATRQEDGSRTGCESETAHGPEQASHSHEKGQAEVALPAPLLLTSLSSHTSRPPLALSIRKTAAMSIASIAYTFSTRRSWSIGIQDLHITPAKTTPAKPDEKPSPEITTTRLAFTPPMDIGAARFANNTPAASPGLSSSTPATPERASRQETDSSPSATASPLLSAPSSPSSSAPIPGGPTTLCYTHPYLLAALPDNTLMLYLCTATAASLSVSPGIRLWGHTSGISDAEITARGRAVSVCSRGGEMRVWELEGRAGGKSVEIRAAAAAAAAAAGSEFRTGSMSASPAASVPAAAGVAEEYDWDERRNWVGFDDEMVIVLKERTGGGRESLMVYDFT